MKIVNLRSPIVLSANAFIFFLKPVLNGSLSNTPFLAFFMFSFPIDWPERPLNQGPPLELDVYPQIFPRPLPLFTALLSSQPSSYYTDLHPLRGLDSSGAEKRDPPTTSVSIQEPVWLPETGYPS